MIENPVSSEHTLQAVNTGMTDVNASVTELVLEVGDVLFNSGDSGNSAYVIVSGQIEVFRPSLTPDAEVTSIAILNAGQVLGEMALVDGSSRSASARAVQKTELIVIPVDVFEYKLDRLNQTDPIMRRLIEMFVIRLRGMIDSISH